MKQLNKKEQEQLQEAFNAVCNLFFATEKDNFSKCSSFHIKPFNTHWDKKTVKEVMLRMCYLHLRKLKDGNCTKTCDGF